MKDHDIRHMRHALVLAARGLGRVWPNPSVGCVLVRDGAVVGRGRTADGGRPHAETEAIAMAGKLSRGATAYVTLEPCAHHGNTPPCSDALIEAGVARVVCALTDPDPRVAGQGLERLRAAGLEVTSGVLANEAAALQGGYLSRVERGRPMVSLKLATTLDGRIATASGESRWITGSAARRKVHALRARHDAVLVGGGTARADDPDLTVRAFRTDRQPVRIVATRHLRLQRESRLFRTAGETPVWLLCGDTGVDEREARAWETAGARLIRVASSDGQLSPSAMLESLGSEGLTRVLCEGGGMLAASFLIAGLVDELLVFSSGKLIGAEGRPAVGPLGLSSLSEATNFRLAESHPVGEDMFQRWVRRD